MVELVELEIRELLTEFELQGRDSNHCAGFCPLCP